MQKITPFLWFDGNAEEALNFYVSTFKNAKMNHLSRQNGKVFTGSFSIDGQEFMALNGGPMHKFTPAISFLISCKTQEEVDELWANLSEGGRKDRCGWLQDKFGVSWQIIPSALGKMLGDKNRAKAKATMQAMLKMNKLDIAELNRAYEQA
jgi:predicted 3-demethylubiquinone-9 3-methyltransferase (glyoxalase superfamily)